MPHRYRSGRRSTRRLLLRDGIGSAFAALGLPALLAGAEGGRDTGTLQPYDKVEPHQFPWGSIRWLMNGQIDPEAEMTMGLVYFEPNQVNTQHFHPNSAEFLHALSGTSEHRVGSGPWVTLKPGDTLRIPKNVPHQARTGAEAFRALIVYDTPTRIMIPVPTGDEDVPPRTPRKR